MQKKACVFTKITIFLYLFLVLFKLNMLITMVYAMGKVLLFYKYVSVENPHAIMKWQREVCEQLQLKGRIILAPHGINATLGGSFAATEEYKKIMNEHPLFNGIDFKESEGDDTYFPRLRIVVKEELINFKQKFDIKKTGKHLTPEEAHELIKNNKDLVILDGRNYYEARIGKFANAITPKIATFREFPQYVHENKEIFKDKDVLMYCTGGIRCEPASAFFKEATEARNVYQIEGGIHRYAEKFPDGFFRGKNYVFDARITVRVNDDILAQCEHCNTPYDDFINCYNTLCNKQIIVCPPCAQTYHNTCSSTCLDTIQNNPKFMRPKPLRKIQNSCSL